MNIKYMLFLLKRYLLGFGSGIGMGFSVQIYNNLYNNLFKKTTNLDDRVIKSYRLPFTDYYTQIKCIIKQI